MTSSDQRDQKRLVKAVGFALWLDGGLQNPKSMEGHGDQFEV